MFPADVAGLDVVEARLRHRLRLGMARPARCPAGRDRQLRAAARHRPPATARARPRVPAAPRERRGDTLRRRVLRSGDLGVRSEPLVRSVHVDTRGGTVAASRGTPRLSHQFGSDHALLAGAGRDSSRGPSAAPAVRPAPHGMAGRRRGQRRVPPPARRDDSRLARERLRGGRAPRAAARTKARRPHTPT